MKNLFIFIAAAFFFTGSCIGQNETKLLFSQELLNTGSAINSTYSLSSGIDFEVADNFSFTGDSIGMLVFYGLSLKNTNNGWEEIVPGEENFLIKFYHYLEEENPGINAAISGTYKIALLDSWADGWNGATLSVFVNDQEIFTDLSLSSGSGPEYFSFHANQGDNIHTLYSAGSYSYENYYAILDPENNIIAEEGGQWENPSASTPSGILPAGIVIPVEPQWSNPLSEQVAMAEVSNEGLFWDNQFQIYKYTVILDSAIDLQQGWISIQSDSDQASGAWFFWVNSFQGDNWSWQRGSILRREPKSRNDPLMTHLEAKPLRNINSCDMAFELWSAPVTYNEVTLNLKVILEGAYIQDKENPMHTLINDFIPLNHPFNPSLPFFDNYNPVWFHQGSEAVRKMPDDIVDWVLIELRSEDDNVLGKQAALLKDTGFIVNIDGSFPRLKIEEGKSFFAVIHHRNHLSIISPEVLTEENGIYFWDFTQSSKDQIRIHDKLYVMYSGDGNGNGQIQTQDKNEVWQSESGNSGYNAGDFDLNGQVQIQDKNNFWQKNSGMSSPAINKKK